MRIEEMRMFTGEQRDYVRDHVLAMARADPRVTAGALTGSRAVGAEDEWSDIDLAFGIVDGISLEAVLDDWTEALGRDLGALHYWDLRSGSSIYRVFLLPTGIEVDAAVTPQQEFGAHGPSFRALFGTSRQPEPSQQSGTQSQYRYLVGLGWHHVLHARASIERGKPWRAEYWISGVRDHTLALACLRLGEEPSNARGIDRLPPTITSPLEDALVHSLDQAKLRRALAVATECFMRELDAWDPVLCSELKPVLQRFGALHRADGLRAEGGRSPARRDQPIEST
jgi:predicted nucleotidyltransferase